MEIVSNCCGAPPLWETDLCSDCKEHADFYDDEEYDAIFEQEKREYLQQDCKDGICTCCEDSKYYGM